MFKHLARIFGLTRWRGFFRPQPADREAPHFAESRLKAAGSLSTKVDFCVPGVNLNDPPVRRYAPASDAQPAAPVSQIRLPNGLDAYLIQQGNSIKDIARLRHILSMERVILETGCGGGEVAWQIASKNQQIGVIATDKYDWAGCADEGSGYRKVAQSWKDGRLKVQQAILDNLVVLRAEADLLHFLPDQSIDTVLLVNPEPTIGAVFVESLQKVGWLSKVKPGRRKIVIKPFSREMNVMSCGGYEFDHSEDWSCGLGFILGSGLPFKKAHPVNWAVDLSSASPYCKNSTQNCVYVYGDAESPAIITL